MVVHKGLLSFFTVLYAVLPCGLQGLPCHLPTYLPWEAGWRHRIQVWRSIPWGKLFPWYLWPS